jgi:ATP-dependent RNA helicase RhlE
VFGGVGHVPQQRALARGVDVLVATPGRLIDHLGTKHARLDHTEVLVLDEADQMLDAGFLPPIRKIVAQVPKQRVTMFFSATMPPDIARLAADMLTDPVRVEAAPGRHHGRARQPARDHPRRQLQARRADLAAQDRGRRPHADLQPHQARRGQDRGLAGAGRPGRQRHPRQQGQSQRERRLADFKSGRRRSWSRPTSRPAASTCPT